MEPRERGLREPPSTNQGTGSCKIYFDARFDDRADTDEDVVAEAHFDDVYLGSAGDGHCE